MGTANTVKRLVCEIGESLILERQRKRPRLFYRELKRHEFDRLAFLEILFQLPANEFRATVYEDSSKPIVFNDYVSRLCLTHDRCRSGLVHCSDARW